MDATVDDFLKEINEIVPPKAKNAKSTWKECFDYKSGYTYYWNVQTDEVTWQVPDELKNSTEHKSKTRNKLYIPPKTESLLGRLCTIPPVCGDSVKIYKIDDVNKAKSPPSRTIKDADVREVTKNKSKSSSDSEDEKIVLISSYGGETESEDEVEQTKHKEILDVRSPNKERSPSDGEDDDTDLLTQIQNRAKVLKDLGGELPEGVKKLVCDTGSIRKNDVTGFSLVAGYGDDSEDEEDAKPLFPIKVEDNVAHSTLFPIPEQIDVNQFVIKSHDAPTTLDENVDVKAFQRKRRIAVDLLNVQKPKEPIERSGLGYKSNEYPQFKSGGVMFVKSDVLQPSVSPQPTDDAKDEDEKINDEIERVQVNLGQKLRFLSEGHNPALPVQIMIIQMETLYAAMKADSLKPLYLKTWLKDTCEQLVKLEKEAAPAGWLLQWDRLNKRYYYHNQMTGESQWEYPQPDIVGGDDAMDICTTPPPPPVDLSDSMNMILPPPPPRITERNVTPPPPPVISGCKPNETDEPLPPGVDAREIPKETDRIEQDINEDTLSMILDSFYSDIAAIEDNKPISVEETHTQIVNPDENTLQSSKKRKKTKMAQGLAMKKKGVSKMVEKWKNVQKNYE